MAKQTFALAATTYTIIGTTSKRWVSNTDPGFGDINADLLAPGGTPWLSAVDVRSDGRVRIELDASDTEDLSDLVESSGSFTIIAGANKLTVNFAGLDTSEPYLFAPSNSAEVITFFNALPTTNDSQAATFILRDFEPITLASLSTVGFEVDANALFLRTSSNRLYESTVRGGTDAPIAGEIGLGAANTPLTRFFWATNVDFFVFNDDSTALDLNAYFGPGGDGADLSMFIVTDAGQASAPMSDIYPTAGNKGNDFIQFGSDTSHPIPSDMVTLLDGIDVGDFFILAFMRTVVGPAPINFLFDMPAATGRTTPPDFRGNASPINAAFEVPAATGRAAAAPPTAFTGNAEPINAAFAMPAATGRTSAPNFRGNAGPITMAFVMPAVTGETATPGFVNIEGEIVFGAPSVIGILDIDTTTRAVRHQPRDNLNWLIAQYGGATRLRRLLQGLMDVSDTQVVQPLMMMNRGLNPDEISGVLLDWLGTRLSFPRPFIMVSDRKYFGFRGTSAEGGATFGQAPFFTRRAGIESLEPIGDATYRLLLKARARRLRNDAQPNRVTYNAILMILFGNGYLDESGAAPILMTTTDNTLLFTLVQRNIEKLFPRKPGLALTLQRTT